MKSLEQKLIKLVESEGISPKELDLTKLNEMMKKEAPEGFNHLADTIESVYSGDEFKLLSIAVRRNYEADREFGPDQTYCLNVYSANNS